MGGLNTFAYVQNDPVNWSDPKGLAPYDLYPNLEAAGKQAIVEINPTSIRKKQNMLVGYVAIVMEVVFIRHQIRARKIGHMTEYARREHRHERGNYHTHGDYDKKYDSENFSKDDKTNLDKDGLPCFLGTPKGSIKIYTPMPGKPMGSTVETLKGRAR